jgi:hypothetical protein
MKRGDTRGLSTIIATLLIILLVMVSVAIVWGVVRSLIKTNAESISLGKFTISLEIVSIRQTAEDVNIKVKRNVGEGEVESLIFSIFDGEDTHIFEIENVSLKELETKTFVVDYQGDIVSVSVYPVFLGGNGKATTGEVQDTYYIYATGGSGGPGGPGGEIDPNCTVSCAGKVCGDDGCGGSCGPCFGTNPYCIEGHCEPDDGGIEPDCTCAVSTCIGTTCDDGLGGSCAGELQPDCINNLGYPIMCGIPDNGCGGIYACGTCPDGYHCNGGVCSQDCTVQCAGKECGDNGCGGSCGYCEVLYGSNYICNINNLCEVCLPNCAGRECGSVPNGCGPTCGDCAILYNETYNCNALGNCEMCTPNCGTRECGSVPNGCGESCGNCTETYGYPEGSCTSEGMCYFETVINQGTIYSIWPIDIGLYFDSTDLPTSGEDYFSYYVKFPGSSEIDCLRIWDFVTPVLPPYNMSYIRLAATSTAIRAGDNYEVWPTIEGCCRDYFCE